MSALQTPGSKPIEARGARRRHAAAGIAARAVVAGALLWAAGCDRSPNEGGAPNENSPVDAGSKIAQLSNNSEAGSGDWLECNVKAPTDCPASPPTYEDDIGPLLDRRCVVCHMGEPGGPWPLTSYSHAVDWFDIIRGAMLNCTMPPPDQSEYTITNAERVELLTWLRCGSPRD